MPASATGDTEKLRNTRLSRPHDARAVRSRESLRAALLRLIERRPLEDIQIKEITEEAGLSYPVFFRQYKKKQDILDEIAADQIRQLIDNSLPMFDRKETRRSIWNLCEYVEEHRVLWTRLLTTGAADAMRAEFKRCAREISAERGRLSPSLPAELTESIVVSGLFELLAWWLRQPEDYPTANVVALLTNLVIDPVYRDIELKEFPVRPVRVRDGRRRT